MAGAPLVGYRPENLVDATPGPVTAFWEPWAPWAGVVLFGIGAHVTFSAPRNSLAWVLLLLLLTFAVQQVTAGLFGKEMSDFFGTLVATPLGYLVQKRFRGPPAMVTFLPSFWLLVPWALGLSSVKRLLSDRAHLDGLVSVAFALASIALGTLMGASLYKGLGEGFAWWRHQAGRTVRYFRATWRRWVRDPRPLGVARDRADGEEDLLVGQVVGAADEAGVAAVHQDGPVALGIASQRGDQLPPFRVVELTEIHGPFLPEKRRPMT
jgi:uncharacterized membrane protein YjjB (DUF3815 family)